MTWIDVIEFENAEKRLKKLYDQVITPEGQIDNILKAHSLRPPTLHAHLWLYKASMHTKPNELSNREREIVAVCVSKTNECTYCVNHHQAGLARIVGSEELAQELALASVREKVSEAFTSKERALCEYAIKLTKFPENMVEADIIKLREIGLTDYGILDLNQIVAYFAYANRTVNGLGINTKGEILGLHPSEDQEGFGHH